MQDRTQTETADIIGCSQKTVSKHAARAPRKMAEFLNTRACRVRWAEEKIG
ncbi:hypothetical protein D3C87_2157730 [compost metagenome]